MSSQTLKLLIGLPGVPENERPVARRWANRFELPMILLALWIMIEWYLKAKGVYPATFDRITDWGIWLFFVLETVVLTSLVKNKLHYLRSNWMNLLIISTGIPLLWGGGTYAAALRTLRVLLILPILLNTSVGVRKVLAQNHLGTVLLLALAFTLMSGLLIAGIDPGIETIWQVWCCRNFVWGRFLFPADGQFFRLLCFARRDGDRGGRSRGNIPAERYRKAHRCHGANTAAHRKTARQPMKTCL